MAFDWLRRLTGAENASDGISNHAVLARRIPAAYGRFNGMDAVQGFADAGPENRECRRDGLFGCAVPIQTGAIAPFRIELNSAN